MHDRAGTGRLHPGAILFARDCLQGRMDRREFMTRATALGVGAATAAAMIGLPAPARAQEAEPVAGGTIRMNMETRPTRDPRLWAWSEEANFCRGWLEYLVEYQADGSLRGMLLERWEANDDATRWELHLRPGTSWNNGDAFTAADVLFNLRRWCDGSVEGNSMAARLDVLRNPASGRMREDAVEIVDEATLRLHASAPDIALIVNLADYPAALVHPSYDGGDPAADPIGTGPYLPEENEPGVRQVLVRNADHGWWGGQVWGGPWLDRIEYVDLGTDPALIFDAAERGEIDASDQTATDFVELYDAIGWERSEALTAATVAVRFHQDVPPFDDPRLRRAIIDAVDNEVVLELGHGGMGLVAENHHVCPIHPEYATGINRPPDPEGTREFLRTTGYRQIALELVSLDDDWQSMTCDAVAAQMRDAGFTVKRTVVPPAIYREEWRDYLFSATEWNMRPLGVQVLNLAYKSGGAWNETGFANDEFDALLARAGTIANADSRRVVMARLEEILIENDVMIQPYWRMLYRHVTPGLHGFEMHPTLEHHHYKWWRDEE